MRNDNEYAIVTQYNMVWAFPKVPESEGSGPMAKTITVPPPTSAPQAGSTSLRRDWEGVYAQQKWPIARKACPQAIQKEKKAAIH